VYLDGAYLTTVDYGGNPQSEWTFAAGTAGNHLLKIQPRFRGSYKIGDQVYYEYDRLVVYHFWGCPPGVAQGPGAGNMVAAGSGSRPAGLAAPAAAPAAAAPTVVRKYYYLGGQRVALRENSAVYWLHTDHLGSTAITLKSDGTVYGELRYWPYGQTRLATGTTPTKRRFTGQLEEDTIALYDYGARFYDPLLGRFVSADTVVPEPGNPQAFNRYSYVLNRPLAGGDPTGHQGPIPGVGALPWQSGFSLPSISPDAVQALSVAAPAVPVVIAGGEAAVVVVAVGTPIVVGVYAIGYSTLEPPDYPVPLEFDPNTANATYVLPGYNTVGAPTAGVSPSVYNSDDLDWTPNLEGKTAHYGKKSPSWKDIQLGGPNGSWKWWILFILAAGTPCYYSQCSQNCTLPSEEPPVFVIEIEPTPTSPPSYSWQKPWQPIPTSPPSYGPGKKIPVEAW